MAGLHVERRLLKRETRGGERMNGPRESWVDLNEGQSSKRVSGSRSGLTVLANTPTRPPNARERVASAQPLIQGQVELLNSQFTSLLQEKPLLRIGEEKSFKENGKREMEQSKIKNKSVTFQEESTSALQLQVSALRQALEQASKDKNILRELLTKEKEQSDLQLAEEKYRNQIETETKLKEKEEEIGGLRAQLIKLRQELKTIKQITTKKTQETNDEVNEKLREKEELLIESERERSALHERLTALELERQLSMIQYQEEMGTSVMAVTTQLEELLDLNKQLQAEVTHLQSERDGLSLKIENEKKNKDILNKEKDREVAVYKEQVLSLTSQLEKTKEKFKEESQLKADQSSLTAAFELTRQELEKKLHEAEADAATQIILLKEENQSLQSQLEGMTNLNERLKLECKRLKDQLGSVQDELTKGQREKGTVDAQLVTALSELNSYQRQSSQLKNNLKELTLTHQQANAVLIQQTEQLQEAVETIKQMKNRNKELNKELEAATALTSSQTESMETLNQQLRLKVIELEKDLASQKKLSIEYKEHFEQRNLQDEVKQCQIEEMEKTIEKLKNELTALQEECESASNLQTKLLSVQNRATSLQLENDKLSTKLRGELEQVRVMTEANEKLKKENKELKERLILTSSPHMSSSGPPSSPPPLATHNSSRAIASSSSSDVLSLRQQLAEAHCALQNLEKQNSKSVSDMAKVQGSMEAMSQLLDHLHKENKSLTSIMNSVEEEKDKYKQELTNSRETLEAMRSNVSLSLSQTHAQLVYITRKLEENQTTNGNQSEIEKLRLTAAAIKDLSSTLANETAEEPLTSLNQHRLNLSFNLEEVQALEEKVSTACHKVEEMKEVLEEKERELEEKEKELVTLRGGGGGAAVTRHRMDEKIESIKKDLETQYQAKLAVLRNKLMESEDKVMKLKSVEQELRTSLGDSEVTLVSHEEEMAAAKEELYRLRELVHLYEASLSSEAHLLECESQAQLNSLDAMKKELEKVKATNTTSNNGVGDTAEGEGSSKEAELISCNERILELQGQVEALKAKKTIFDRYILTQERNEETTILQQRNELMKHSTQLREENEELKTELIRLNEAIQQLQDNIEIMSLRLEEAQEEAAERERDINYQGNDSSNTDLEGSLLLQERSTLLQENAQLTQENEELRSELERLSEATGHMQDRIDIMALRLEEAQEEAVASREMMTEERDHEELKEARAEIDKLNEEIKTLRVEMEVSEASHRDTVEKWQELLEVKESSLANASGSSLEKSLHHTSINSSIQNNDHERKINKVKTKLKMQIKKNNELRIKLGYILSELRLYKQLKLELDCQVHQLQQSLKLSKDKYKECLHRLNNAEINHFHS